jgi:hypothetical protein
MKQDICLMNDALMTAGPKGTLGKAIIGSRLYLGLKGTLQLKVTVRGSHCFTMPLPLNEPEDILLISQNRFGL